MCALIYFSKRFLNTFSSVCVCARARVRKSIWRTNNLLTVDILPYLPKNLVSREVESIEEELHDAIALLQIPISVQNDAGYTLMFLLSFSSSLSLSDVIEQQDMITNQLHLSLKQALLHLLLRRELLSHVQGREEENDGVD